MEKAEVWSTVRVCWGGSKEEKEEGEEEKVMMAVVAEVLSLV